MQTTEPCSWVWYSDTQSGEDSREAQYLAGLKELATDFGVAVVVRGRDGLRLGGHQVLQQDAARQPARLAGLLQRTARAQRDEKSA